MGISVSTQVYQLLSSCLAGAATGAFYDVLRLLRIRHRRLALFADGLLCLEVCMALFYLTMSLGDGQFRLFYVSGLMMGLVLWLTAISPIFTVLIGCISCKILRIINYIHQSLTFVLKKLKNLRKMQKNSFHFGKDVIE